jgi:hypothetical protein
MKEFKNATAVLTLAHSQSSFETTRYLVCTLSFKTDYYGDIANKFHIRAQIDSNSGQNSFYGWHNASDIEMDNVDGCNIGDTYKAYKAIDRKLRAMEDNEGHPASFGEFINRMLRATGLTSMDVIADDACKDLAWIPENWCRKRVREIDHIAKAWFAKYRKEDGENVSTLREA